MGKALPYRPCAGVMLINATSQVFVAQRLDHSVSGAWQMPQGGIDKGEDTRQAALRELKEETGIVADKVEVLAAAREPLRYNLPDDLIGKLWGGKYRGQEQHWFLARFLGQDSDIDLEAHDPPEFSRWQWADPESLPDLIVPFKREVYAAVLDEFRALI